MNINNNLAKNKINPVISYPNTDIYKQKIINDNKNKPGIYRWVNNINGKSYIGSGKTLSTRISRYFNYRNLAERRPNMLIHKALLKYGYSNFSLEILEYCNLTNLLEREQYYIDTLQPEYNILKFVTSSLGLKLSEETKEKLRQIQLKIHESLEFQTKKILANPNSMKIQLLNINTNEILVFESIRDAARKLAIIEGRSEDTIRGSLLRSLKKNSLYLTKYKITKIILEE